jgi:AP-2 complex subunit mu-1
LNGIFKEYFGKKYTEETIRDNFTLVYELLDETMDYGYPQNCSIDVLKMYINLGQLSVRHFVSPSFFILNNNFYSMNYVAIIT